MKKNLLMKRPGLNGRGNDATDYIYAQMKIALFNYYYLIRADLKKRWKILTKEERREAVGGLRYLEGVFKNPDAHFSRAATQDAWNNRAVKYAKDKCIGVVDAFYIVHGPREQFIENVKNACYSHDLYSGLYKLAGCIQNWEYDRTSQQAWVRSGAQKFADEIANTARETQKIVDVMESNPLVRPLKQMVYNFQR